MGSITSKGAEQWPPQLIALSKLYAFLPLSLLLLSPNPIRLKVNSTTGFPGGSVVKNLPGNARDAGSIPELGRSSWGGNGNWLQYSCLENSMGRGAGWATVHRVAKNLTRLSTHTSPRHAQTALTAVADLGPNGNLLQPYWTTGKEVLSFRGLYAAWSFLGPSSLPLGKPYLTRKPTQRKRLLLSDVTWGSKFCHTWICPLSFPMLCAQRSSFSCLS